MLSNASVASSLTWGQILTVALPGLLGFVGALAGAWVAPRLTAKEARKTWLQQQQVELYRDALLHAQSLKAFVESKEDVNEDRSTPRYSYGTRIEPKDADDIAARMHLLGDDAVARAWTKMIQAYEVVAWNYEESYGGAPDEHFDPDDLAALRSAVQAFRNSCRLT